ncbi:ATPase, T2SS/T4P/T4SS family [Stratiformator vulcanicus]|uniref:Type II secretion system protein E n=1 Tax=Stratiformator vulcanicus TaxID=2527980 RepID=A0A517R063_9PLAN|nr:ATPase, T2SS/T4P/T4SS family [Stratiformator vulcanicus]QDT37286.1 Type II secretion system protein E [Stratiformator vulcanicus]
MAGRRNPSDDDFDDEFEDEGFEEDEDVDYVLFQGALNGRTPDLSRHARLTQAALMPAKDLITDALLRRAEMILIEPRGNAAMIRLFIDGVAYPGGRMQMRQAAAVSQMLKLLTGLNPQTRDRKQRGGVKAELDEIPYELHIDFEPSKGGERLTIRCKNLKHKPEKPSELGLHEALREKIREVSGSNNGCLFVSGPPMSGVSASTIGVLKSIDVYIYSIFVLESLGEEVPMMTPFEKNEEETLEAQIERCLRREPDVLYIGELDGEEKLNIAFQYADVTSIVSQFAAADAVGGLAKLLKISGDSEAVAKNVAGIISPKLVRKLCEKCRQAFRPNPKILAKVGLPPETKLLYRAAKPPAEDDPDAELYEPCEKCGGTGYFGRVGIYEFLIMSDAVKEVVRGRPDGAKIRQLMKSEEMPTYQREGLRLVADGVTTLEELQRILRSK